MKIKEIIKTIFIGILIFLSCSVLQADVNDNDKILILTNYLVEHEGMDVAEARNEAIATIYGEPSFEDMVYDDISEMFFAKIVSQRGGFSKDVNFYMPRQRAIELMKNVDDSLIEIKHAFDDNEIVIKTIELEYKGINYPLSIKESTNFTLKIGGFFVTSIDTELQARKNGVGAIVDFQELFNMDKKAKLFRLEMEYKFNPKHRVEFSYYSFSNSNYSVVGKSFEYNGEKIDAGASLGVKFNTDTYKLNYAYSAYQTNRLDFSFRVGLHVTEVATGIEGVFQLTGDDRAFKNESVQLTAPLPVIGLGIDYEIVSGVALKYRIDYFFLSYDDYSGTMLDTLLALEYHYNQYIGAGIGFNATNMNLNAKVDESDFKFNHDNSGILGYLIFSY